MGFPCSSPEGCAAIRAGGRRFAKFHRNVRDAHQTHQLSVVALLLVAEVPVETTDSWPGDVAQNRDALVTAGPDRKAYSCGGTRRQRSNRKVGGVHEPQSAT
jgi:hypothetical protein